MTRKKIVFLITKSNFGGAQRYVFDLATSLPTDQFEVVVAAGGSGFLASRLRERGIRYAEIPGLRRDIGFLTEFRAFFTVLALVRKERPDILHLNSSKIGAMGALIGRMARVPKIIFTAHGWPFAEERFFLAKALFKVMAWLTVLLVHRTIVVSEGMRRAISLPGKRVSVIHHGLNPRETLLREDAESALSERGARFSGLPSIGTIAELHPIKGLRYAMAAIALLRDRGYHLTYVILGEGDQRRELERLIKEQGLEDTVFLAGFVPDASRYLSAFDIVLMSSLHEGLGYAVLEAGAAERPIVATRVGGLPEIIENGVNGLLVPPRDAAALANALQQLLDQPEMRAIFANTLSDKIRRDFTFERMLEETIRLYTH